MKKIFLEKIWNLNYKGGRANKRLTLLVAILFIFSLVGCSSTEVASSKGNSDSKQTEVIQSNDSQNKEEVKEEPKEEAIDTDIHKEEKNESNSTDGKEDLFKGYKLIEVDGGDLSGHREPNVVVDIGFGDREYYAFTNEYGQLVKVTAKKITLQDDSKEPVNSKGRYYDDEAKVPGTESKSLDEGHIIADSLGGVSNAYNITPQNSTLNRHGDQAYMEDAIRKAGGCTDFVAIITYPNTKTQTPSHYSYTYKIKGHEVKDDFDNVNPDEYNANLNKNDSNKNTNTNSNKKPASSNTSNKKPANNNESNKKPSSNNTSNKNNSSSSSSKGTVYWTPNGKSYHTTKDCSTLSRSKVINSGTIEQSGKSDPCDKCN